MKDNILPPKTRTLIEKLNQANPSFLSSFYLSGGTGLALQLHHRQSEDLDFFSQQEFDSQLLLAELKNLGKTFQVEIAPNTLNLYLDEVKLQFLTYPYPLLKPLIKWQKLQLSSTLDIALTKLITISQRGSKKDFIDLYFILQQFNLNKLFSLLDKKYPQVNYNKLHLLKSLTYFDEAETQPMPKMLVDLEWNKIKTSILKIIRTTLL